MAGGTHISSFAQGTSTPFNPIPVPSLLNASPIQHQFSPSFGAQPATSVSSPFSYSRSLSSSSYQSIPPPSISLTSDNTPIPAKLQPASSSNMASNPGPLFIVLDFDGTITEEDTIETLARYAAHYQAIKAGVKRPDSSPGGTPTAGPSNSGNVQEKPIEWQLPDNIPKASNKGLKDTAPDPKAFNWQLPDNVPMAPSKGLKDTAANPQGRTPTGSSEELAGAKTSQVPEPSLVSATSLLRDWRDSVLTPYDKDLKKFESRYQLSEKKRKTWEEEEDYLDRLRTVEDNSIKRVEASPMFKGFDSHDFWRFGREAVNGPTEYPLEFLPCLKPPRDFQNPQAPPPGFGLPSGLNPPPGLNSPPRLNPSTSKIGVQQDELTSVKLRKGFKKFHKEKKEEWKFGLVSVNWSHYFIKGVLTSDVDEKDQKGTDSDSKPEIIKPEGWFGILANHITPQPIIKGPPGSGGPLTTARDKAKAFSQLRARVGPTRSVVYIGDSETDLLCLRDADLGIVIADDPKKSPVVSTLRRLEGSVPHISNATLMKHYVWARDFDEIIDSGLLTRLAQKSG